MAKPTAGKTYRHAADDGLGVRAAGALSGEMAELDLTPEVRVTVVGYDDDRGLVLVEWPDGQGNPRITSVDPGDLDSDFVKECPVATSKLSQYANQQALEAVLGKTQSP